MGKYTVLDFVEKAQACSNLDVLTTLFQGSMHSFGFEKWAYVHRSTKGSDIPEIIHNYPKEWVDHYIEGACHEIDPVVVGASKQVAPFKWSAFSKEFEDTNRLRAYTDEAREFGLVDGLAIPIPHIGKKSSIISVCSGGHQREINKKLAAYHNQLIAISYAYHSLATELITQAPQKCSGLLSEREQEYMLLVIKGFVTKQIARMMDVSNRTVEFHNVRIRQKLGAPNIQSAIVRAILEGHLPTEAT